MYHFVKSSGLVPALTKELPYTAIAIAIAEVFYKFHSFTLECIAFLATWFILGWLGSFVERALFRAKRSISS